MSVTAWQPLGTASTAPQPAGTGKAGFWSWNGTWTVANLSAQDSTWAQAETFSQDGQTTHFGIATNFDFSALPGDATIDGIEVRAVCASSNKNRTVECIEAKLTLDGTTASGNNLANPTLFHQSAPLDMIIGGASNTWGLSLTRADIVNSNFGVMLQFKRNYASGGTSARVDVVEMRVHYTASGNSGGGRPVVGSKSGVNFGLFKTSGSATFQVMERRRNGATIPNSGGTIYTLTIDDVGNQLSSVIKVMDGGQSSTIETPAVTIPSAWP